jgi:hypothetical protein
MVRKTEGLMHRTKQTNRQADRQTDSRQRYVETEMETLDRQKDIQRGRETNRQARSQTDVREMTNVSAYQIVKIDSKKFLAFR